MEVLIEDISEHLIIRFLEYINIIVNKLLLSETRFWLELILLEFDNLLAYWR